MTKKHNSANGTDITDNRVNAAQDRDENLIILVVSLMYILFVFLIRYLGRMENPNALFGIKKNGTEIMGAISEIPVLMSIWMTVRCRRRGYPAAMILCGLQLISMLTTLFRSGNTGIIPGSVVLFAGVVIITILHRDVVQIRGNEEKLNVLANTDELTGLPNRRSLMNRLNNLTAVREHFSLVFIDIDNFKNINDTCGHDYGDKVLMGIASRWQRVLTENDCIARLGGDEFALIIRNFPSNDELLHHINEFMEELNNEIVIDNHSHAVTASFGVVICPENAAETTQLLRYADTAMYSIKAHGKSQIAVFNAGMAADIESEAKIESEIRTAIENESFYVVFQPQYSTETKTLKGFEALARMKSSSGSVISPVQFIPIAEKCGLISKVERIVIRKALSSMKPFADKYRGKLLLAVNISAVHLQEENFIADMWDIINSTGFPSNSLEIEITESVLITSVAQSIEKLCTLKKMGVKIALDDFGTCYASLNYLRMLPIDMIKLDKSFVDNIEKENEEANFVNAIISLGHTLNYSVLSEGVETEGQLSILRSLKCDHIQGFVWGTPLEYETACELISTVL